MRLLYIIVLLASLSIVQSTKLDYILLDDEKTYNLTWQDQNCVQPTSVSFYKLVNVTGYFTIGDYAQPNYNAVGTFDNWNIPYGPGMAFRETQVTENQDSLTMSVTQYQKIWDSTYYGSEFNCTIWRPISPDPDYYVLGDVVTFGLDTLPIRESLMAVHKSCVTMCSLGPMLWSSWNVDSATADVYGLASPNGDVVTGTFWTVVSDSDDNTATQYPCLLKKCLSNTAPQQIHIATGSSIDTFRINWMTYQPTQTSTVRYGTSSGKYTSEIYGYGYVFTDGGLNRRQTLYHHADVIGLEPNTTYFYQVGDEKGGWSAEYSFTTLATGLPPLRMLVYGDMGYENSRSYQLLKAEVNSEQYDMILHVGDLAYDMDDHDGKRGDNFMRMVEPLAARLPYMVCPGNHETAYNFSHYQNRFDNMPFEESGSSTNFYFSWDYSYVHFISFSTEAYFSQPLDWGLIETQYNWLEQDLITANQNRVETPWIIAMGHRPMYCSDNSKRSAFVYTDCTSDAATLRNGPDGKSFGIEPLFYKYGVDLYLTAHEHSYERMYPVYDGQVISTSYVNPAAPVHIVNGAAGCPEGLDGFGTPGPWTAFRSESYGYAHMYIYNSTTLYWEQIGDSNGSVLDSFVLYQENHGTFNL